MGHGQEALQIEVPPERETAGQRLRQDQEVDPAGQPRRQDAHAQRPDQQPRPVAGNELQPLSL